METFKCPLKTKFFYLFILSNKTLTWDVLVKKGREGPARCFLCKMDVEYHFHLGVDCSFTQSVWLIIEDKLKLNNLWSGEFVSECLKFWCLNSEVAHIKSLPVIVLWFMVAHIKSCFEDLTLSPAQVSSFSLGMMMALPQKNTVVIIRSIFVEVIDESFACGYFDGFAAGEPKICGVGGMLYISDEHYFSYKEGLGLGTNDYAELCALKLLLFLARRNSLAKIQIFGDSQLVINWASSKFRLMNLDLSMILQEVNRLMWCSNIYIGKEILMQMSWQKLEG